MILLHAEYVVFPVEEEFKRIDVKGILVGVFWGRLFYMENLDICCQVKSLPKLVCYVIVVTVQPTYAV